ncbi:glycosyltransferase [Oenococcus sp.]|uniref:glycosyltransferase n=1 Tax=Oenococcus sp. TaxID=1979414 RepID=UPI0039E8859B
MAKEVIVQPQLGIATINYLNWQDTIEMVTSLKKQSLQDFHLVIVDNGSNNDSMTQLSKQYAADPQISLIESKKNLGFAKANNLAIELLKKKYELEKVLIINNDLIFQDDSYLAKLSQIRYASDVGAVGTSILTATGFQQNPVYDVTTLLRLLEQNWDFFFFPLFHWRHNLFRKISQWAGKPRPERGDYERNKSFILHGAAILLTENYLSWSKGFYPKTFLYFEENILHIIFEKAGLKMCFQPISGIYHKEDQSSKLAKQDDAFKIKLLSKNTRKAILLRLLPSSLIRRIMSDN